MRKKLLLFPVWGAWLASNAWSLADPRTYDNATFALLSTATLVWYSAVQKAFKKTAQLLLVAFVVGTVAEAVSLRYGTVFGAKYDYLFSWGWGVWGVPLQISLFWAVFYYLTHTVTNHLHITRTRVRILVDGVTMTALDLLMDPIMVSLGAWRWHSSGPFYGIPTGNFLGWFGVTIVISVIVRRILKISLEDHDWFVRVSFVTVIAFLLLKFSTL